MKKLLSLVLTIVLLISILVLLLVPSLITNNGNQADETNTATKPNETTKPDEPTIQTDGGEEDAGSGYYDEFFEKYTIVKPPVSSDTRISVIMDAVAGFDDIMYKNDTNCLIDIQTTEGKPVVRHHNKLYILESDTVAREIGTIWEAGDEAVEYYMHNGDYVFTLNMELVDITVEYGYINSAYSAGLRYYDLENATPVRLEVSNFANKEVRCFVIGEEGETEVPRGERP